MSLLHIKDQKPRLYGRRKGRPLRARKARLMEELLPRLQFDAASLGVLKPGALDPATLFHFASKTIQLEIGFGGGEHLATQAKGNPDTGFIGCEPFLNGIASLLDHIDRDNIANIRIFPSDARVLLDALQDKSIARCFVLFPDPWPKARHADRRFISAATCVQLARVMPAEAELRLASDDPGMIAWFRHIMNASPFFRREQDTIVPPEDWVQTRYEQKAIKAGRPPAYMTYRRI